MLPTKNLSHLCIIAIALTTTACSKKHKPTEGESAPVVSAPSPSPEVSSTSIDTPSVPAITTPVVNPNLPSPPAVSPAPSASPVVAAPLTPELTVAKYKSLSWESGEKSTNSGGTLLVQKTKISATEQKINWVETCEVRSENGKVLNQAQLKLFSAINWKSESFEVTVPKHKSVEFKVSGKKFTCVADLNAGIFKFKLDTDELQIQPVSGQAVSLRKLN